MDFIKNKRIRIFLALGTLVVAVVVVTAYYLSIYAKTPEHAVEQITVAVRQHDTKKFNRYVDLDSIAESGYDEFTAGILDTQNALSGESLAIIRDFGRIIKNPMIVGFKKAVIDYVETGSWENTVRDDNGIDTNELVERLNFAGFEIKNTDKITKVDDQTATLEVTLFDRENRKDFLLEIGLVKENGDWRVKSINNVHDYVVFVSKARRQKIVDYLSASGKIIAEHDNIIREADFEFQKILSQGSLGKDSTRFALKQLMENTVIKDWQTRKEELTTLSVPKEAINLQRLRLRICDLNIAYAEGYAQWMSDKKVATIRAAEGELKQARTLDTEAAFLLQRMIGNGESER